MFQSWNAALISPLTAGPLVANTTVASTLLPPFAIIPIPGGFLNIGSALRITACGAISNVATTPGTLTLDVRLGSAIVWSSGPMNLSLTAHTSAPIWYQILLTARTVGQTTQATLMGQ